METTDCCYEYFDMVLLPQSNDIPSVIRVRIWPFAVYRSGVSRPVTFVQRLHDGLAMLERRAIDEPTGQIVFVSCVLVEEIVNLLHLRFMANSMQGYDRVG